MDGYRHILLAVDCQPDSEKVTQRALDLSRRYEARLSLIHVVENMPVEPGNELMIPPTAAVESELLENAERKLRSIGERLEVPADRQIVVVGQTKHEVLSHAREAAVDLIVVGSHGRHGLALLLGSTANSLLRGAPCDVLAVRI